MDINLQGVTFVLTCVGTDEANHSDWRQHSGKGHETGMTSQKDILLLTK